MKKDEATATLDAGVAKLRDALMSGRSDEFENYLRVMSRFHQYSFGNLILILMQRPEATRVAGFHAWKQFGRSVKKGATGIGILAPCTYKKKAEDDEQEQVAVRGFKMVHVFDVADTEGDELPEFPGVKGDAGDKLFRLEQVYRELGIELEYGPLPPNCLGLSQDGSVVIRPTLSDTDKIAVGVHELAHEILHKGERRHGASKTLKETEAEAVAFVVCDALGLDSTAKSSDYLSLHEGSAEQLSESLDYIQKTAKLILEHLEAIELDDTEPRAESGREVEETVSAIACDHTLHAFDELGRLTGTWTTAPDENGLAVRCSGCGKFYGYLPAADDDQTTELLTTESETVDETEEEPEYRVGRADYEERKEERIERYQDRASRRQEEANATHARARQMAEAIPFGQPILVGHHSEQRDRNYRERIHNTFGKSFEFQSKAKYWAGRAAAAESSTAISSDDPQAIAKLEAKLADLEDFQATMKAINAAWRQAGRPESDDVDGWTKVAVDGVSAEEIECIRTDFGKHWHTDRQPIPGYSLTNNNGNMRRVRERIAELKRSANAEHLEQDRGVCQYVQNAEENRVQLVFDDKPPKETRELLKQNGFRWSRRNGAWQRLLNSQGKRAAEYVIAALQPQEESVND